MNNDDSINPNFLDDPDTLAVNCTMYEGSPFVCWRLQGKEGLITISDTRARAEILLTAAAIAVNEAAIINGLSSVPYQPKGFGKAKPMKSQEIAVQMVHLVRGFRPAMPEGVEIIYGMKTKRGIVKLSDRWYGKEIQWFHEDLREHAMQLLEAAEAAQSDAFLYYFIQDVLDMKREDVYPMIQEFGLFRQKNQLEDLFKRQSTDS